MLKKYLFLTKPGILFGNFITTLGGYFVAAQGSVDFLLLLLTLLGTTLVVASGCVVNNIIDQDIDQKMQRTQNRALVKKTVSVPIALIYSVVLGIIGFSILWFGVNAYAFLFALIGFVVYVGFYSLWTKRTTIHQTIIGSISGASPPVIGYTAVANQFDLAALLIFLGYALWQMPHSWAIAIYRFDDYKNAGIPILPVARSILRTKIESLIYVVLFTVAMNGLFVFGYANWLYLVILNTLCIYWFYIGVIGFKAENDQLWAKRFFLFSVILITVVSLCFSFTATAPSTQIILF
ncbi:MULTISPECIES: heme o synthase [Acinetobacter]|uniref:heme o synthase n=1 Tax=Acinetobacter TaxID=469 RepID=UPI0014367A67|nr:MULTISPECIES: heme o synthase [Acinetobacter]MCA4813833.1 protoheme IX farnesyltransferase [Acinetobacter towneri]MCO8057876.1 heme o synthase [Acinetobacter towneri]MCO8063522.1 heme o synthase [Acinetobacter towneri]NWK51270.1 protoheme IX farnesyltransferase [Acinetobacter sp. SwsAc5]QIV92618.1 protoheme IX farnesyltransferase [Acinetobacter towneri]